MAEPPDFGDSSDSDDEDGLVQEKKTTTKASAAAKKRKKPSTAATKKGVKKATAKKAGAKKPPKKKKRKSTSGDKKGGFIDDAAVESGSEEESEEEEGDEINDYERDGFVVDEEDVDEEAPRKKSTTGLEDSDEDSGDDSNDDAEFSKKRSKIKRVRDMDVLDDDDLDLINEARGLPTKSSRQLAEEKERSEKKKEMEHLVKGRNEAELSRGLFTGDTDDEEEDGPSKKSQKQRQKQHSVERYDEDGLDDFIEDDVGDGDYGQGRSGGDDVMMGGGGGGGGVSESMLQEHLDIFGTDFMEFMDNGTKNEDDLDDDDLDKKKRRKKYRERGVGVDLGVDSDEEMIEDDSDDSDDDDDDLFGDDDMDQDMGDKQRAEVLKLKREKKRMAKEERRRQRNERISAKRKAQLRRAFEPVMLVENFCTERDDAIRMVDSPERYYDWIEANPSKRILPKVGDEVTEDEEEESFWIMQKIPAIHSEWAVISATLATPGENVTMDDDATEKKERAVLTSIIYALRYMRIEKLEPEFIKRYRQDVVSSPAVRANLYRIMDEDSEWERMTEARSKIESTLTAESQKNEEGEELIVLKDQLSRAEEKLQGTVQDEERVKVDIEELEKASSNSEGEKKKKEDDDDDDDDDLFGDDDDDDDEAAKEAKVKQKESLQSHLSTITTLLDSQAQEVARLVTLCREKEAESAAAALGVATSEGTDIVNVFSARSKKMCKDKLWHYGDYSEYVLSMIEYRQVMDMKGYLNLVKEGNEAIKDKTSLLGGAAAGAAGKEKNGKKKRSRRFDWDYYRTCVSEGLRSIAYQFVLPPFRVGIKLEDTLTSKNGFSYDRTLPGDDGDDADMEIGDPRQWVAPVVDGLNPQEFGSQLIDSGELVSLATAREDAAWDENPELTDPLRACRYVAAMELAHEPRIRRQLRAIYRSEAVITTRPTSKGMGMIDAFHEYYGLHLLKDKPVKEHFPMDESELGKKRARLNVEEVKDLDVELKRRETNSCIQYLNLLKAERGGDITLQVHLPYMHDVSDADTPWYKRNPEALSRDRQNIGRLMEALERVYLPADGDTDEWNDERKKILRMALVNYLMPQFEAETRRDLKDVSTRIGVEAAGQNLQLMAMEGPYRPSHLLGENRFIVPTGDLPIVGVCSSNDARDGTFLAAVNGRGELSDHVAVPGGTSITSDQMRERVITFLMQTRPAAVVVGSSGGLGSRMTARRLGEVLTMATERWNNRLIQGQDEDDEDFESRMDAFRMMHPNIDDDEDIVWKCNVDIVDDNVAQLFGRSVRGKKEFPDTAVNLKVAIATARWAKDPLCELAYTWSAASDAGVFGTEMLFLNIHPLQRLLPKPMLLREFERVLCHATAEVGVDINGACSYDHMHGLLTFVPGLGPRKANNLKQNVARIGGVVSSRKSILAKRLFGPIVYNNSVAFLRVRATDQLQDQMLHPLDDSRCHPDVYQRNRWAVKIAVDALELGDGAAQDDEYAISAIRDVMQNSREEVERLFHATKAEWEGVYGPTFNVGTWDPKVTVPTESWRDKVEELDIEAFADMIEQNGNGKWLSQLTMVKWEYRLPYEDPRKPMEPPSGEKLFKLLTGETDATLCPGKEVTGKVVKNGDFGSQVKLEGDVPGFIPLRNLADDHVESAEDIVSVGTVVTALITQVKMDHMCVDLTLKKEDFRKKSSEWERPASLPPLDDFFDRVAALKIDVEKDKEREARLEALRLTIGGTKIGGDSQGGDGSGEPARRSGKVTRRACAHPAFRNATHDKLDKELKEAGDAMVGEALIRPSNKSCDSLAIHWMVRPGCIKVIEVLEEDKDTDASIGNRLTIKKEVYESIDELLGRYIAPMNDRVEEVQHHRKFLDKLEDEIDDKLQVMKKANPAGVFYFVCWSESYPGYVSLRFIMGRTARHHTLGISPDGFIWGPKTYSSMDRLMNDFKKNPTGPGARPPNRPPGGSSTSSMSTSRQATQGTGGRTEESSRQSRWGARSSSAAPPSRWGGAAMPPPPGPPPAFAAPPGQPPAFSYSRPPPPGAPPGYTR
mmetsp:Transcript_31486/g.66230  ORF Transcript_31486/g.66230 Transcript_31486/m.66230 type:complete len:2030 (+) Transcript_31486:171-6260(+)|eukprot:CAMPEP_0172316902 /NCGR_PEP_ID=MMETSP1058-20130122/29937_1 /TAXON_ID=83371 /ORGANISM="Detonula confervacea, Strain CCMP 353" /LENGTH=2029 /DNA_ID=CAMNT_0013031339 /DNA_START=160 /DNA_END=6249 /DNA_ORIENTATION=-